MAESSEKTPSLFSAVFTHLFTAVLSGVVFGVGGFLSGVYLNAPQEGSPNLLTLRRLGLTEPPSLDCPGLKQDTFYGDFRKQILECGWLGYTITDADISYNRELVALIEKGWLEAKYCSTDGWNICVFLFYKPTGENLVVKTISNSHTVRDYYTYWDE